MSQMMHTLHTLRDIRRKDEVRAATEQDKIAFEGRIAATFDLQQVLTAPKLNVGAAYYLRKLNVYNLCVYELQTHEGFAYMWNESEGNRGANEIATAVYTWLSAKDEEKFKECILYSDSCGGQNRNKMMSTMIISFLLQSSSRAALRLCIRNSSKSVIPSWSVTVCTV